MRNQETKNTDFFRIFEKRYGHEGLESFIVLNQKVINDPRPSGNSNFELKIEETKN